MLTIEQIRQEARNLLEHAVVIDTESTGLGENDTIVELAAVRAFDRSVIFNSLVIPSSPMHPAAEAVHGISTIMAHAHGQSTNSAINDLIERASDASCTFITAYNLPFDRRLIEQSMLKNTTPPHPPHFISLLLMTDSPCIMELANRFFHEHLEWCQERSQFKRLSLEKCLKIAGIEREGIAHRALSDALAATDLLRFIAGED